MAALFGSNSNIDVSSIATFLKENSWRKSVVDGGDGGATFIAISSSITDKELGVVGFQRTKKVVECKIYYIQSKNPAGKFDLYLLASGNYYLTVEQFFERRKTTWSLADSQEREAFLQQVM